jgi:hypothetical protein
MEDEAIKNMMTPRKINPAKDVVIIFFRIFMVGPPAMNEDKYEKPEKL